jgi:hypothetical protein
VMMTFISARHSASSSPVKGASRTTTPRIACFGKHACAGRERVPNSRSRDPLRTAIALWTARLARDRVRGRAIASDVSDVRQRPRGLVQGAKRPMSVGASAQIWPSRLCAAHYDAAGDLFLRSRR